MYMLLFIPQSSDYHYGVIKRKHFPRYWPFVRGIHRSSVNSPHKGQWRGALMFSMICAWMNGWVNNREADDLGSHSAHNDVTVMGRDVTSEVHWNTLLLVGYLCLGWFISIKILFEKWVHMLSGGIKIVYCQSSGLAKTIYSSCYDDDNNNSNIRNADSFLTYISFQT